MEDGDRRYWWSERAMVGVTALAADRIGWKSLQEYPGNYQGGGKRVVDLWLYSSEGGEFPSEAKHKYCSAEDVHNSKSGIPSKIVKAFKEAEAQFLEFDGNENDEQLIIIFAVPYFNKGRAVDPEWISKSRSLFDSRLPDLASNGFEFKYADIYESQNEIVLKTPDRNFQQIPGFAFIVFSRKMYEHQWDY